MFSALLDRNRAARCIVFTGESGAYIGAAAPRDVRASIGARFPEYESAWLNAYKNLDLAAWSLNDFQNGDLSENALNQIAKGFLSSVSAISLPATPVGPTRPDAPWLEIDRTAKQGMKTWELAEYVTAAGLPSMLGTQLERARVQKGFTEESMARSIIGKSGRFVALVDSAEAFVGLCDRTVLTDRVARKIVEETKPV
ncbi:hypothetical protein AWB78_04120 [Caballeronia calidae]|uniref:Uncharacterized protein n=1 Tax=Caballeronia calidae TaxID=1777139 RepID=A0A158CLR8_9BURK|nr:hypothetical protein [Caballeronia calidae]SAK83333.1 hypothetical protein AWB78_04120 [Caballeronia calidae]